VNTGAQHIGWPVIYVTNATKKTALISMILIYYITAFRNHKNEGKVSFHHNQLGLILMIQQYILSKQINVKC
jgi:hypothetical protein